MVSKHWHAGLFDEKGRRIKIGPGLVIAWNKKAQNIQFFFALKPIEIGPKVNLKKVGIGEGQDYLAAQFIRTAANFDDFVAILCRMFGLGFEVRFMDGFARAAQLREWEQHSSERAIRPV